MNSPVSRINATTCASRASEDPHTAGMLARTKCSAANSSAPIGTARCRKRFDEIEIERSNVGGARRLGPAAEDHGQHHEPGASKSKQFDDSHENTPQCGHSQMWPLRESYPLSSAPSQGNESRLSVIRPQKRVKPGQNALVPVFAQSAPHRR